VRIVHYWSQFQAVGDQLPHLCVLREFRQRLASAPEGLRRCERGPSGTDAKHLPKGALFNGTAQIVS